MLRTALRRVQLSPRSAVSPFVCIFCQKKGPNLERRLTTKDVGQSKSVEPPPIAKTPDSSSEKSQSLMDILRKDMLERKEGKSRKKGAKKAKAAAEEKKESKVKRGKKKKGISLFQAEAAVAMSPKKKKALQRARGTTMPGLSISEALRGGAEDGKYELYDSKSEKIEPIEIENQPEVAKLSHGLDRVLFNPGVHFLQEPRSGVYNFDPYLQDIMPVTEFDFDAVASYIISSEDQKLSSLAKKLGKKYVGSTSSMTAVLTHFHFLLSQWRQLNFLGLSKTFKAEFKTFTQITRAPAAIFLRYKGDGTYAIDPDKEYDTDSVLSLLGRSMEKLLTSAPSNFESKYKKGSPRTEEIKGPETYHYSTLGDFLMRSQLDAFDPRLPGTGMFDLKTRAVVSVRMDVANFHIGSGYQIKTRIGTWESFEREYYDMMRAAFLKYSLQVRMGRMDGIFVAFHNTEKIFGFQYVPLAEMDAALHEDWNSGIGDQEFRLSLQLLNKVLDNAIKKYPEQSLHLYFETRDISRNPMVVIAEPLDEEEIERRQTGNKHDLAEFLEALDNQIKGGGPISASQGLEEQGKENEKGTILSDEEEAVQNDIQEEEADEEEVDDHSENHLEEPEESESEEDSDESDAEDAKEIEASQDAEEISEAGIEGDIKEAEANQDSQEIAEKIIEDAAETLEDKPEDTKATYLAGAGGSTEVEEAPKLPEMYVQVMYVKNYENGKPVLRPMRLTEHDNWKVAVAIDELPPKAAYMTYLGVMKRRKKAIEHRMVTEDDAEAGAYIRQLRNMARAGRDWAKSQEKMFPGEPVVYKPGSS